MPRPGLSSQVTHRRLLYLPILLTAISPSARGYDVASEPGATPAEQGSDQVTALIRELGAADYASRENAQAKLGRLGLDVFDQLYDAQASDDIEVALRARYLLRSLTIRWAQDDDPLRVKELLRSYGDKAEDERRNLVDQLSKLPEGQGLMAICRIVRFETSNVLSKQAALLVMQRKFNADAPAVAMISQTIMSSVGNSRREAANWLRTYVATLRDPAATLADWAAISDKEERGFHNNPERSSPEVVRDLLRWRADLLGRLGREEESLAVILKTIDLLDGTREQLLDAVDWLLERRAWPTIEEVAKRFRERFQESTLLLYRYAEVQSQCGRPAEAEKTAEQALKSNQDSHHEHILAAYSLQERGLFVWSEREYRFVIERVPPSTQEGLQARLFFSEMLHDLQREKDAAEAIRDAVEAVEKDENVRYLVARFRKEPGSLASRMHYFLAEHARLGGDLKLYVEHLKKAVERDPTDADVLIAMYRASDKDPACAQKHLI